MKTIIYVLALIGAVSAAAVPVSEPEANPLIQKRCTPGSEIHAWCTSACGYNCRVTYGSCRNIQGPQGCAEAYSRMVSYCTTCCNSGGNDCRSCQNCGNYYPQPMPA